MQSNNGNGHDEVNELLGKMLTSHAYRERLAATRFEEASDLAPDARTRAYVRGVVTEETEHYEACVATARSLGIDIEARVQRRLLQVPEGIPRFRTWLDVLLAHALNDEAGLFVLRGLVGSCVPAYASLAKHIVDDEVLHGSRGRSMLTAYWPTAPESASEKIVKFREHVDAGVRCLGRPDTPGDAFAIRSGLKTIPASTLVTSYGVYVDGVATDLGIPFATRDDHGNAHELTTLAR